MSFYTIQSIFYPSSLLLPLFPSHLPPQIKSFLCCCFCISPFMTLVSHYPHLYSNSIFIQKVPACCSLNSPQKRSKQILYLKKFNILFCCIPTQDVSNTVYFLQSWGREVELVNIFFVFIQHLSWEFCILLPNQLRTCLLLCIV